MREPFNPRQKIKIFIVSWYFLAPPTATFGGNANGTPCSFPFKYGADRYCNTFLSIAVFVDLIQSKSPERKWKIFLLRRYECITDGHDQPWCGTTRNYETDRLWGNCGATSCEYNEQFEPICSPWRSQVSTPTLHRAHIFNCQMLEKDLKLKRKQCPTLFASKIGCD